MRVKTQCLASPGTEHRSKKLLTIDMELIKKYKIVILILVPVIVLVILRLSGTSNFKPDASRWAEPSFSGANIITAEKASTLAEKILVINFDSEQKSFPQGSEIVAIPSDSVIGKDLIKRIKGFEGVVLIYSDDISEASGVWMTLSQMGITNIMVLTDEKDNEALKYKFRPDSLTVP